MRFVQTSGGRTGVPAPRRVRRRPFVQWQAPLVWTTLSLTLHADGRSEHALIGASRFPRHWVYGDDNRLSHKSGLTDFKDWYRKSFGKHSPWGDQDSEALVTAVETALETLAVGPADAGRRQAPDRALPRRRRPRQAGRPGHGGLPRPRRGHPRRARRRAPGRVRARARSSGSGPTSRAAPARRATRRHAVPGGPVRGRSHRPLASRGAVRGTPPRRPRRETEPVRVHSAGPGGRRRPRDPTSSATAGTPPASRCPSDGDDPGAPTDAPPRRGHGSAAAPELLGRPPVPRHHPPDPPALGPRTGAALLRQRRPRRRPRHACSCPTGRRAPTPRACWRG